MKKILIIGAGFLQSFVIKRAKELGYFTLAVDADPKAVGFQYADKYAVINIVDQKACLAFAEQEKIDGVLTAATDYGVLTAAYIAQEMGLPGLKYESAVRIKNKYLVRKCLFENRVDDTQQAYEVNKNTDIDEIARKLIYPVMVKPCDGSGSRGASRVDNADGLLVACNNAMNSSITHRAEIETFIDGKEYGCESLVTGDGKIHVLSVMRKWMTEPPYYAELGHAIPTDLDPKIEEKVRVCVQNAIKALNLNFGSVNMDLLVTSKGNVHIIDIGARMGGNMIGPSIIPYGTGIDYVGCMIQNAVGDEVPFMKDTTYAVATRLLAFQEGVVTNIPDFAEIEKKYNVEIVHHIMLGEKVNEYHTNLDGLGYIIAKANSIETAIDNADKAKEMIGKLIFQ